ncbi:ATP-dependent DNA helicase Q5 [Blomia tropicalis]|nr:ATP-dependent DNA helicase Q5 [Blomia tropicalis]
MSNNSPLKITDFFSKSNSQSLNKSTSKTVKRKELDIKVENRKNSSTRKRYIKNFDNFHHDSTINYFAKKPKVETFIDNNDNGDIVNESINSCGKLNNTILVEKFDTPKEALKKVFGYDNFRNSLQEEAVNVAIEGKCDIFVSMPTGAGKSMCYQLPAIFERDKITFVTVLKQREINAESYNSQTSPADKARIMNDLMSQCVKTKLLYITPEMATSSSFYSIADHLFRTGQLGRIAIDEAHCVSQWGHDFRPSYVKLGNLKARYPSIAWIALTATASSKIVNDIFEVLKFRQPVRKFIMSNFRPNIYYDVFFKDAYPQPLEELKKFVIDILGPKDLIIQRDSNIFVKAKQICNRPELDKMSVGIIYCRTREQCEEIASILSGTINEKSSEKGKKNQEHSMESFEKMVSYCKNDTKCRHSIMLAEFVGDEGIVSSGCKSCCDVCVEPKMLKTRLAQFEIAHHKKSYGQRSTTNETDEDDSFFLPRIDEPITTKETQMKDVVKEEFRLRNSGFVKASTLKHQANKSKDIDLNIRKHFSQKLLQEIKCHFDKLSELDQSIVINNPIEEIADKEESKLYASKNNKMMYRAGIANYLKQLRDSTKLGQIYEPIKNYIN